jgi:hypothetical protein
MVGVDGSMDYLRAEVRKKKWVRARVWKKPFPNYLCHQIIRGALIQRAEIIPIPPDPGNAGEGK